MPHTGVAPLRAAETAAADSDAAALIGPFRSADVAEAIEASAPAGLPLHRAVATWAGVTRDDEPGCEDDRGATAGRCCASSRATPRSPARIAADLRATGRRALVVAGGHEYGVQLDGQLRLARLPRTEDPADAGLVVLCALAGAPEIDARRRARAAARRRVRRRAGRRSRARA